MIDERGENGKKAELRDQMKLRKKFFEIGSVGKNQNGMMKKREGKRVGRTGDRPLGGGVAMRNVCSHLPFVFPSIFE